MTKGIPASLSASSPAAKTSFVVMSRSSATSIGIPKSFTISNLPSIPASLATLLLSSSMTISALPSGLFSSLTMCLSTKRSWIDGPMGSIRFRPSISSPRSFSEKTSLNLPGRPYATPDMTTRAPFLLGKVVPRPLRSTSILEGPGTCSFPSATEGRSLTASVVTLISNLDLASMNPLL